MTSRRQLLHEALAAIVSYERQPDAVDLSSIKEAILDELDDLEHGTRAGYLRHRRRGEDACRRCKQAARDWSRNQRAGSTGPLERQTEDNNKEEGGQ